MNAQIPQASSSTPLQQSEFLLVGCRHGSESALEHRQKHRLSVISEVVLAKGPGNVSHTITHRVKTRVESFWSS